MLCNKIFHSIFQPLYTKKRWQRLVLNLYGPEDVQNDSQLKRRWDFMESHDQFLSLVHCVEIRIESPTCDGGEKQMASVLGRMTSLKVLKLRYDPKYKMDNAIPICSLLMSFPKSNLEVLDIDWHGPNLLQSKWVSQISRKNREKMTLIVISNIWCRHLCAKFVRPFYKFASNLFLEIH